MARFFFTFHFVFKMRNIVLVGMGDSSIMSSSHIQSGAIYYPSTVPEKTRRWSQVNPSKLPSFRVLNSSPGGRTKGEMSVSPGIEVSDLVGRGEREWTREKE